MILDGRQLANKIKNQLANKIKLLDRHPGLGIILVGDRPDSKIYIRMKKKACLKVGIKNFDVSLSKDVDKETLIDEIEKMNKNGNIDAILIQLPLPKHLNEREILSKVDIKKDVDGFHCENVGNLTLNNGNFNAPCTPCGCIKILDHYGIKIQGKNVVVIGRSNIVGLPLSLLFLHRNATVTICHSKTKNLFEHTKKADILIVACGKPQFIKKEHVKKNVVILDIGINKIPFDNKKGYKLVGDVNYDSVLDKTLAITPVPGGVGPMTIAMLLKKTFFLSQTVTNPLSTMISTSNKSNNV